MEKIKGIDSKGNHLYDDNGQLKIQRVTNENKDFLDILGEEDSSDKPINGQLDQEIQKATNENFFNMIGEDSDDKLISLNKACKWLEDKLDYCEIECYDEEKFINDFKEAMEGGEE